MSMASHLSDDATAAFDRHARLARQEKADPSLIDCPAFQKRRRAAFRRFLKIFTGGAA